MSSEVNATVASVDPLTKASGPKIRNIGLRRVKVTDLEDAEFNFRTHPESQQNALGDTIDELGFYGYPDVYLTPGGTLKICDGHLRKSVLIKKYGIDAEIDVNVTDFTEAEAKKAIATKDPITEMATADKVKLDSLLRDVNTGSDAVGKMLSDLASKHGVIPKDSSGGGGGGGGSKKEIDAESKEAQAAELVKKWGVEVGQLWQLGKHRLLCDDSTQLGNMERVLAGDLIAVVITDPPYGIDLQNHNSSGGCSKRSTDSSEIVSDQSQDAGNTVLDLIESLPCIVFASPKKPWPGEWKQHLVWDKGGAVGGGGDPSTYWKMTWELIQVRNTGKLNGQRDNSVLEYHVSCQAYEHHPTQKPVKLIAYLIEKTTNAGEIVFEPFCGSGTAILACENTDRICRAIEITPGYVAVTLQRYQDATGTTPVLLSEEDFVDVGSEAAEATEAAEAEETQTPSDSIPI